MIFWGNIPQCRSALVFWWINVMAEHGKCARAQRRLFLTSSKAGRFLEEDVLQTRFHDFLQVSPGTGGSAPGVARRVLWP